MNDSVATGDQLSGLGGIARKSLQDLVFPVTSVHLETTHMLLAPVISLTHTMPHLGSSKDTSSYVKKLEKLS